MGIYCPGLLGSLLALAADAAGPEVPVSNSVNSVAFHCLHIDFKCFSQTTRNCLDEEETRIPQVEEMLREKKLTQDEQQWWSLKKRLGKIQVLWQSCDFQRKSWQSHLLLTELRSHLCARAQAVAGTSPPSPLGSQLPAKGSMGTCSRCELCY